jgi:hypothetical protein
MIDHCPVCNLVLIYNPNKQLDFQIECLNEADHFSWLSMDGDSWINIDFHERIGYQYSIADKTVHISYPTHVDLIQAEFDSIGKFVDYAREFTANMLPNLMFL